MATLAEGQKAVACSHPLDPKSTQSLTWPTAVACSRPLDPKPKAQSLPKVFQLVGCGSRSLPKSARTLPDPKHSPKFLTHLLACHTISSARRFPCRLRSIDPSAWRVLGTVTGTSKSAFQSLVRGLARHPEVRFAWSWVGYSKPKAESLWRAVAPWTRSLLSGIGRDMVSEGVSRLRLC